MINSILAHPNQLQPESYVTDMMDHASPCTTDPVCLVYMQLLDFQKKKGVKQSLQKVPPVASFMPFVSINLNA